jgi:hypothetical protein
MQSYFCFKCSQQIPEPELERGQVVLTKEGKLFCLRCLRRVQTRYPILLFASFFLFTFLFLIQIFQWISQGGHLFNSAVSAQKLEERLEEYLKREELEEKLLKQRSSLRKEAVALTEQEILPYFDQITALKKQIQLLQENTVSSEIPRNGSSRDPEFTENASLQAFQKQLDQQLKAFADFQNHLQSLHHKIETLTQEQKLLSQKWIELQKMSLSVGEKTPRDYQRRNRTSTTP